MPTTAGNCTIEVINPQNLDGLCQLNSSLLLLLLNLLLNVWSCIWYNCLLNIFFFKG